VRQIVTLRFNGREARTGTPPLAGPADELLPPPAYHDALQDA
jgi:hypothetical protein